MAKLTVTITVTLTVIFSLFILSHARIPLAQPSNLVTEYKPSESDDNNKEFLQTLRLPSDRSETETETIQISDISAGSGSESESESNTDSIRAIGITRPLTITYDVSFRPMNHHVHHVHMRHPFWNRFPHRCRHHHHQGQGKHMVGLRERSFGNDMIVSSEKPENEHTVGPRERSYGNDMILSSDKTEGPRERSYGIDMILSDKTESDRAFGAKRFDQVNREELTRENFAVMRELWGNEFAVEGDEKKEHVDGGDGLWKPIEKIKEEGGSLLKKVRKFLDHF